MRDIKCSRIRQDNHIDRQILWAVAPEGFRQAPTLSHSHPILKGFQDRRELRLAIRLLPKKRGVGIGDDPKNIHTFKILQE
jgi:hypothetical protein